MAEATQTLSLVDDAIHEPGDEMWMGHSIIPRDVACCETTVNLPSFPISSAADGDIRKSAFVVNDLTKHPDLSTRPYVTGFPNGRFYAGVPITTPSGVNIGAYCILDDKVRDGISEKDLSFLGDMSQTVVNHLESVRALSERQQTNRMVAGLGDFVRGTSGAARKASPATNVPVKNGGVGVHEACSVQYRSPDALLDPTSTPDTTPSQSVGVTLSAQHENSSSTGNPQVSENRTFHHHQRSSDYNGAPRLTDRKHALLDPHVRRDTVNTSKHVASPGESFTNHPQPRRREDADDPKSTYQRAAEILCQSLELDGVAFLDASVREFGGLSESQNAESNEGSNADSDDSAVMFSHLDPTNESRTEHATVCQVLGFAQTTQNQTMGTRHPTGEPPTKLTESFLRRLMRRNPLGRVWKFDEDFRIYSEDDVSSDESGAGVSAAGAQSSSNEQRKTHRQDRRNDGDILQGVFPGSRCIALNGIWDYTKKRWAVAGLYWTCDPLRNIAKDTEMQFVDAFCDIIVAETKRLDVLGTDKAKSDFISTISHELRSPLHGILGSCELLAEQALDDVATSFVEQINSCGRTLLDIIEHLLDFADLKSRRLRKGAVKSSNISQKLLPPTTSSTADDLKALDMNIALDDLTEDAVVSTVYSFYYGQNAKDHTHPPVILDIDRSDGRPWHCSLATGGWKRVCINLVTNALKYTPSGHIRVFLKQEPKLGSRRRFDAVLTVSDTGKGMSKKFQSDRLFHDFAQEDTLSDGLGLGMHIVSRIVYAMGGSIEVVSDQDGAGTCFTVRVPLEDHPNSERHIGALKESNVTPKAFESIKVDLVTGLHPSANVEVSPSETASALAISSIENILTSLSIRSARCGWQRSNSHDLMIVMEADVSECLKTLRKEATSDNGGGKRKDNIAPILVVCNNSPSAQMLRDQWATDKLQPHLTMEHIALPCGVKQVARAMSSLLRLHEKRTMTVSERSKAHEKLSNDLLANEVAQNDAKTDHQLQIRPLAPRSAAAKVPGIRQFGANSAEILAEVANVVPVQPSPAEVQLVHLPSHRVFDPQALSFSPSVTTRMPEPPLIKVPLASVVVSATKMPTLLLVDDNNVNLKLLAAFAKKHKYPHLTAQDGQIAVDAFVNAHQDVTSQQDTGVHAIGKGAIGIPIVILMDINMPVMDGYEAVQKIRSYEKKHRMEASKIIAVTALQSEAARAEAYGSGFNMFLSKPIKLQDLAKLIPLL
ncbi:hypothetical protein J4E90_010323 [Alternaria incomplexa]|uniref:uncharacterized protein n=1 Tax=Alternaria incomplexa TaxID=1187928 RepID=UPI00222003CD|nr:uncharacterized protein J4E90_010323 [Alternaria incomplexa]KAI4906635.1 hypothetical protein J4E90_010323 [Alternaria incomplexa]